MHLNWIDSIRGRNGGLSYNKTSDTLKLGDAISTLEAKSELLNCNECRLQADCVLRSILKESLDLFYTNLNKYTIADLTRSRTGNALIQIIRQWSEK